MARHTRGSGTFEGPTTQAAARAVDELALAVLAVPGPLQLAILDHLEEHDKMSLGSTCTSLRRASLSWFPEVTVEVVGKTDVASLAAWLERHQACLHLINKLGDSDDAVRYEALEAKWNDSLQALPSSLVASLCLLTHDYHAPVPAVVSTFTALKQLEFGALDEEREQDSDEYDNVPHSFSTHHLRPLTRLIALDLLGIDVGGNAEELLSLPALSGLQELRLFRCNLDEVPQSLSALQQLSFLNLSENRIQNTAPLATLQRVQIVDLSRCGLTAVPAQLAALTAVTMLDLSENPDILDRGWRHLLLLKQMRDLNMRDCGLAAVPEQLAAMTALTKLDLSYHELAGGWQHLMFLTQLLDLQLYCCGLTTVPEQVSALTALTSLELCANEEILDRGWQHLLPLSRLCGLYLQCCGLTAVPEQLSALTALTCLYLSSNEQLAGGWQHLARLTRLQELQLSGCGLAALPEQLSVLTALTSLNLAHNHQLAGGWQHLLPLVQLRVLNLYDLPLLEGQAPTELAALPPQLRITS
ncbi:hypothetical protein D9Q98_004439 [Chlorella vulgaris]|uniref:Uncharacterized protein n=1 Tax=Chlorella vulgaris TaxID=3077 RepID=A0A9D4YXI1_CHLVU|nr:hypothetical protein D9Q98_004439 [Chlorella vulgaris]